MAGATTRNLTILLTDIEDFTPKTSRKTRADILRMLEEHKGIVLPVFEGKGGRLIKTIGLMCALPSMRAKSPSPITTSSGNP